MIGFTEFMEALPNGRTPYPWQRTFAETAADFGPPEVVGVPTGCGKTTVVEALIWALAKQADLPRANRTVGVRTVWAIDRRILVDEVFAQADSLADLLNQAWKGKESDDPLYVIADRLQRLKDPDGTLGEEEIGRPLAVTRWRGGLDLAPPNRHPLQAEIITSTVGQIGSRLLFRGYGLGRRSRPLGAALSACDTTICLDEAHLAEPFAATVRSIAARRGEEPEPVAPPVSVVRLSATLDDEGSSSGHLALSEEDREVLAPRLNAPKIAHLVDPDDESEQGQAEAMVDALRGHLEAGATRIACVTNSVRAARLVFDRVDRELKTADRMLLVGPQRPADRQATFAANVAPREGDPPESPPTRRAVLFEGAETQVPLIVIATQTIEVGLDIDVEAMVTQSASASSLTQRFGRLNRAGLDGVVGRATIVRQRSFPLYEVDEDQTWEWLLSLPETTNGVDVSIASLLAHPAPASRRRNVAKPLGDDELARLIETNPGPHKMAEPDIDVFLRGVDSEPNDDVSLFWRCDLRESDPSADDYRDALLRLAPPSRAELLSLSLKATRNLLRNLTGAANARGATLWRQTVGGADLEGVGPDEAGFNPADHDFDRIPFFVLRDREWLPGAVRAGSLSKSVGISEIGAGDLIAIPTSMGGSDEFGLDPTKEIGTDVADDLRFGQPNTDASPAPIRITHEALMEAFRPEPTDRGPYAQHVDGLLRSIGRLGREMEREETGPDRYVDIAGRVLELLHEHPRIVGLRAEDVVLKRVGRARNAEAPMLEDEIAAFDSLEMDDLTADPFDSTSMVALEGEEADDRAGMGWVIAPRPDDRDALREQSDDPPTIAEHCLAVAERAQQFAHASGLSQEITETIRLAGLAHDLGKADPRMQSLFHGGVAPALGESLAKSVFGTSDRSRDAAARNASGMPQALRHEQSSVAIMLEALDSDVVRADQSDLLLHLIGSHHGTQHPLPPVPHGGLPPRTFAVRANGIEGQSRGDGDDGWSRGEAFHRSNQLRRRFGPWALAYLEALLILADRTVSAEGR